MRIGQGEEKMEQRTQHVVAVSGILSLVVFALLLSLAG